jgi:hypothetical protein
MLNSELGMTKERYFEMCEMMWSQPVDEQIPVEFDDLPDQVQQAFSVYRMLRDDWDTMNGVYLGKSYVGIKDIFEICDIPSIEYKLIYQLLMTIDGIRAEEIRKKKPVQK